MKDPVEVLLEDPYTEKDLHYSDRPSRVVNEHGEGGTARPALSPDFRLDNGKYTRVIVGYPLWRMKAPRPMLTLFGDKADYPFAGKGIGAFNSNRYAAANCGSNLCGVLTDSSSADAAAFAFSSSEACLQRFIGSAPALSIREKSGPDVIGSC